MSIGVRTQTIQFAPFKSSDSMYPNWKYLPQIKDVDHASGHNSTGSQDLINWSTSCGVVICVSYDHPIATGVTS